ncbi:MAG: hypothetical protein ACRDLP_16950 [Solirubrobacteraceae bacterium]
MQVFVAADVGAVCDLYEDLLGEEALERSGEAQLRLLADRLADGHRDRRRGAFVELHNWHPRLGAECEAAIWSVDLGERDFLDTVARGHGYASWDAVGSARPAPPFEAALDAVLCGDLVALDASLRADATIVRRRSHWGHGATLLHYLAANGVEIYRAVVPANAADVARLLIDNGADVTSPATLYGGGATTLGLLRTSGPPPGAERAVAALDRVLVDAGAVD